MDFGPRLCDDFSQDPVQILHAKSGVAVPQAPLPDVPCLESCNGPCRPSSSTSARDHQAPSVPTDAPRLHSTRHGRAGITRHKPKKNKGIFARRGSVTVPDSTNTSPRSASVQAKKIEGRQHGKKSRQILHITAQVKQQSRQQSMNHGAARRQRAVTRPAARRAAQASERRYPQLSAQRRQQ